MTGPVLVTGGSGFLGPHVARALAEAGNSVRALVRSTDTSLPPGVTTVSGDLLDRAALGAALDGVRTVVHLAGRAHVVDRRSLDLEAFRRVNVQGTRALLEESAHAGVQHFLFMSSIAASCGKSEQPVSEVTPPAPVSAYGVSKLEAEGLVRQLAAGAGMRALIFRPPLIYGPRMKGNLLRLFHLVASGLPIPVGAVRNQRSVLFVGNLAAAVLAVLGDARSEGTYIVADPEVVSTPLLVRAIARALEVPVRLVPVPTVLLRLAGMFGELASLVVPTGISASAVDGLTSSLVLDSTRLRRAGYAPPHTLAEGLAVTAAWYRAERMQVA